MPRIGTRWTRSSRPGAPPARAAAAGPGGGCPSGGGATPPAVTRGVWIQYSERYYAAFLNDLHGNNVEAVFHSPEPIADAPRRGGVP